MFRKLKQSFKVGSERALLHWGIEKSGLAKSFNQEKARDVVGGFSTTAGTFKRTHKLAEGLGYRMMTTWLHNAPKRIAKKASKIYASAYDKLPYAKTTAQHEEEDLKSQQTMHEKAQNAFINNVIDAHFDVAFPENRSTRKSNEQVILNAVQQMSDDHFKTDLPLAQELIVVGGPKRDVHTTEGVHSFKPTVEKAKPPEFYQDSIHKNLLKMIMTKYGLELSPKASKKP